ncbi:hypothetical protein GGI43DRAFT_428455 [Trichoderma evansii]
MEADCGEQNTGDLENVPLQLEARIEERGVTRKRFRERFSRELAERKTWEENFLSQLEERKTELKTAGTRPPTQAEEQRVQQPDIGEEVREDELSPRLLADMLEREIRQQEFLAQVEEVRIRQDKLFERLEEERIKAEREATRARRKME